MPITTKELREMPDPLFGKEEEKPPRDEVSEAVFGLRALIRKLKEGLMPTKKEKAGKS